MKKETFEEYVQSYIDFYKKYDSKDSQLLKLIINNLHCILNRYKKEEKRNKYKICDTIKERIINHCDYNVDGGWAIREDKIDMLINLIKGDKNV